MNQMATRVGIPVLILAIGLGVAGLMIATRPTAERAEPNVRPPVVEVVAVTAIDSVAKVLATGVVQPAKQIALTPEVTGRIVWQSDDLVPGGRVTKGQNLARIDSRDYAARVEQARSTVKGAQLELQLEQGRQQVAAKEWSLLGKDDAESPLALRAPHLSAAKASVAAAEAGLAQAQNNLGRTVLRAPFNALILDESVDPGQVVGPGSVAATLIGSDEVWVRVSVPVAHLLAVALPTEDAPGSTAWVTQRLGGGSTVKRQGEVTRLLPQLDPQTRTAQLLVTIADPLGEPGGVPLLPGAYVEVSIDGAVIPDAVAVPRTALDGGDTVWIVDAEDQLHARPVTVGWRDADLVFVTVGLAAGERVVISPIALPIDGQQVTPVLPEEG